jgi:hypothetical protein
MNDVSHSQLRRMPGDAVNEVGKAVALFIDVCNRQTQAGAEVDCPLSGEKNNSAKTKRWFGSIGRWLNRSRRSPRNTDVHFGNLTSKLVMDDPAHMASSIHKRQDNNRPISTGLLIKFLGIISLHTAL